jgi:PAS domain-containing protein
MAGQDKSLDFSMLTEFSAGTGVFEFFHPEDIPAVLEKIRRAVENREYVPGAYFRIRHRNGEWRIFHGRGRLLTSRSEDPRLVISSRDVTESRKLEIRVREFRPGCDVRSRHARLHRFGEFAG